MNRPIKYLIPIALILALIGLQLTEQPCMPAEGLAQHCEK